MAYLTISQPIIVFQWFIIDLCLWVRYPIGESDFYNICSFSPANRIRVNLSQDKHCSKYTVKFITFYGLTIPGPMSVVLTIATNISNSQQISGNRCSLELIFDSLYGGCLGSSVLNTWQIDTPSSLIWNFLGGHGNRGWPSKAKRWSENSIGKSNLARCFKTLVLWDVANIFLEGMVYYDDGLHDRRKSGTILEADELVFVKHGFHTIESLASLKGSFSLVWLFRSL